VPAHLARGLQQLLDLRRRQIFAGAPVQIFGSARGDGRVGGRSISRLWCLPIASARANFPILEYWRRFRHCGFLRGFGHGCEYNTPIIGSLWERPRTQICSPAVDRTRHRWLSYGRLPRVEAVAEISGEHVNVADWVPFLRILCSYSKFTPSTCASITSPLCISILNRSFPSNSFACTLFTESLRPHGNCLGHFSDSSLCPNRRIAFVSLTSILKLQQSSPLDQSTFRLTRVASCKSFREITAALQLAGVLQVTLGGPGFH
jgi:hypothetical protein